MVQVGADHQFHQCALNPGAVEPRGPNAQAIYPVGLVVTCFGNQTKPELLRGSSLIDEVDEARCNGFCELCCVWSLIVRSDQEQESGDMCCAVAEAVRHVIDACGS
jgi:hypothetical protein